MTEMFCAYTGDREAALMEYLYDEMAADGRAEFETHLASCARCRVELSSFGRVRRQLAVWQPPNFAGTSPQSVDSVGSRQSAESVPDDETTRRRDDGRRDDASWWREIPAWAQVAAAMLFVGVSAGIANLDVRYDANGLSVRTGWSKPANPANPANLANRANIANPPNPTPWRDDLAALEHALRGELQAVTQNRPRTVVASTTTDAELLRRVKTLVDDSERRQQSELALRIADVLREVNVRRDADLRKIDANLGLIQNRTGVEVLKNRQMLDYYIQRVSQRQ